MITPAQARKLDQSSRVLEEFESKIDAAIQAAASDDRWPCTVSVDRYARVAERVAAKYRAAGWDAAVVHDQRDGDFMQLQRPAERTIKP